MNPKKKLVTSGITDVDQLLGGGIIIGDNVIWYDDAGLLAPVFSLNLIKASRAAKKHLIYINFDYSPKHLLEKLGPLAKNNHLTLLDCFTHGKGESSDLFLNFYDQPKKNLPCRIICIDRPQDADQVAGAFYNLHQSMSGDVRFIFESLTGMQELWGTEDTILKFYASACPRLYELNTIAYWIVEKGAHSERLKAHFNKITQVAVDLSVKRGKTYLTVLKAEKRDLEIVNQPTVYWHQDLQVKLASDNIHTGQIDLGRRLRTLRKRRGVSQKDLARQVGVTPSNISQVENNQVYPSLPALIKIAEVFSVNVGYFLQDEGRGRPDILFPESKAVVMPISGHPRSSFLVRRFFPDTVEARLNPYFIEIPAGETLTGHFLAHKGEEMGYLLSGEIHLTVDEKEKTLSAGDVIYLTTETPSRWQNSGSTPATMLWVTAK